MKILKNYLQITCKRAVALIEKKTEAKLSWRENLQLHIHKNICDGCAAYEKQSRLIDKTLQRHFYTIIENKALERRIISKL